jgi:hypothetical protein
VGSHHLFRAEGLQSARNHVVLVGVLCRLALSARHLIRITDVEKACDIFVFFKQHGGNQINLARG